MSLELNKSAALDEPVMDATRKLRGNIQVSSLTEADMHEWDTFVQGHPQGSPFHMIAWMKSIRDTFQYKPFYLLAKSGQQVRGVLPLFMVKNPVIGCALISAPFAVYGGILADSKESKESLYLKAQELCKEMGGERIELRNAFPEQQYGESNISQYVTFTKETFPEEELLLASLPKKTRNLVRKSMRFDYEVRTQASDFRAFEDLYEKNMRRLGTPCFPREHFSNLKRNFGDIVSVREVLLEGKVVAASFNFCFLNQMHIYYAATDQDYNDKVPNYYMYFDHLLWAGQNGFSTFDFGRCKRDTGVFQFKVHWGTIMRELPYEMVLMGEAAAPNNTPTNPKFRWAIEAWKHMPLPVTRRLGPKLIRLFP